MNRTAAAVSLVAFAVSAAAFAGDPPKKGAEQVEIKLAAKVGDTFRFKQTDASSTEVDGKPYSGAEQSHEYAVAVKASRADGGLDVAVTIDAVQLKMLNARTGTWTVIDTSVLPPPDADMKTKMMDTVARGLVGRAFTVTLDARGAPAAVAGVREALSAGIKGSPFEEMLPVDQIYTDADCMKLAASLFVGAPAGPHAVGGKWSGAATHEVSSAWLDYSTECALSAATADDATVTSKLAWKPDADATADGAKAVGAGEATEKFSRNDGLVVSMKRHLEANRDTGKMKATSHSDATIERLPPKAAVAGKPTEPKKPEPTKK